MLWKAETPINTEALPILFPYCSAIFPTAYKIWDLGINAGKKMLPSFVLLVILSNCFYVLLFVVSSFPALSPQPKQKWTKMNQSFLIGVWWKKTIFAIRKNPAHNMRSLKHFSLWYFVSKIGCIGNSNKIFVFYLVFHSICTIFVPDIGLCAMTDIEESYWTSPVRESAKFNVTKGERLKAASPMVCIDGAIPLVGEL